MRTSPASVARIGTREHPNSDANSLHKVCSVRPAREELHHLSRETHFEGVDETDGTQSQFF
jgi:hypothetical protein